MSPVFGGYTSDQGVNPVIAKRSYLNLGDLKVPQRKNNVCSTLDHLDLTTAAERQAPQASFSPTSAEISGNDHTQKDVKQLPYLLQDYICNTDNYSSSCHYSFNCSKYYACGYYSNTCDIYSSTCGY